mmetsp:Transcript_7752/g.18633  ORF Transcript_7752/g.18633 Transcript_7752/m.18633 type:complete len:331 (+) Transcript_7752:1230-2222(+)
MHPVDTIKTRMIASAARPPPPPAGWSAAAAHASVRPAERIDPSPPAGHEPYLEPSVSAKATTVAEAEHADGEPLHLPSHAARGEEAPRQNLGEGLLSLYQGLPGALLKEGPPSALYLGVYEAVKTRLLVNPLFEPYPILVYLIAGAAGETIGSVVRAPSENIKARVQSGADASTGEAVRSVLLSAKGRENVVRAWSSSLIRDVPFGAIQLAIFEGLKSFLIDSTSIDSTVVDSLASEAVLGAIGGSVGALVTTPPDVISLRILTQPTGSNETQAPAGAVEMAQRIWAEGGFGAFWTGWQARTIYWAPAIGIFLSCYCSIRQLAVSQGFFS